MKSRVYKIVWILLTIVLLSAGVCLLILMDESPIPACFMGGGFGLLFVGLYFTLKHKW